MSRTLFDALQELPDQRGRKGRQIPLPAILALAVAAMLAGADSLIAIFRWGRRLRPEALRLLGFADGGAPCHATYHYVFLSLDADALARVLGRFALGDASPGHIAIDGKTLRGSRRHDAKALHVLSAFATELAAVVGDLVVEPDQNEITAALALLKGLPLEGAVITGDAIFCQREICRHVRDAKGHYLFSVKRNQPELHDAIAESFGDLSPPAARPSFCRVTCAQPRRRSRRHTTGSRRARRRPTPRWWLISAGRAPRRFCASRARAGSRA